MQVFGIRGPGVFANPRSICLQDSNSKIEAVLNDTQKQQFEQMLQERRAHHKAQTRAE